MELSWPFALVGLLAFMMFVWPTLSLLAWCYEASGSLFRRTRAEFRRYRRNQHFHRTGNYTWSPQPFVVTQIWRSLRKGEVPRVEFVRDKEPEPAPTAEPVKLVNGRAPLTGGPDRSRRTHTSAAVRETVRPQPVKKPADTSEPIVRQPQMQPQTSPEPPKPVHPVVATSAPVRWRGDQESRELVTRMIREQPGGMNASDLAKKVRAEHSKANGRKHTPPAEQTIRRMVRQMANAGLIVPVAGGSRPRYVISDASGQPRR